MIVVKIHCYLTFFWLITSILLRPSAFVTKDFKELLLWQDSLWANESFLIGGKWLMQTSLPKCLLVSFWNLSHLLLQLGMSPQNIWKKVMGLGCIAENVPRVHVICRYFQMSSMFPTFFHHPKWCLGPWHFRKIACKPKPFTALKDPRHFHDTICPATSFGWLLAMRIK